MHLSCTFHPCRSPSGSFRACYVHSKKKNRTAAMHYPPFPNPHEKQVGKTNREETPCRNARKEHMQSMQIRQTQDSHNLVAMRRARKESEQRKGSVTYCTSIRIRVPIHIHISMPSKLYNHSPRSESPFTSPVSLTPASPSQQSRKPTRKMLRARARRPAQRAIRPPDAPALWCPRTAAAAQQRHRLASCAPRRRRRPRARGGVALVRPVAGAEKHGAGRAALGSEREGGG